MIISILSELIEIYAHNISSYKMITITCEGKQIIIMTKEWDANKKYFRIYTMKIYVVCELSISHYYICPIFSIM